MVRCPRLFHVQSLGLPFYLLRSSYFWADLGSFRGIIIFLECLLESLMVLVQVPVSCPGHFAGLLSREPDVVLCGSARML